MMKEEKRTTSIDCTKAVDEYIQKADWRIRANSNVDYSHPGMINNLAGKVIANYWLDNVYSKELSELHRSGAIHIHDLDCLAPYCFTKDTKIKTIEYGDITIEELLNKNIKSFTVISFDKDNNKFVNGKALDLRCTRKNSELIQLNFEDGTIVKCTPDHKFLLKNGNWIEAQNITEKDEILNY